VGVLQLRRRMRARYRHENASFEQSCGRASRARTLVLLSVGGKGSPPESRVPHSRPPRSSHRTKWDSASCESGTEDISAPSACSNAPQNPNPMCGVEGAVPRAFVETTHSVTPGARDKLTPNTDGSPSDPGFLSYEPVGRRFAWRWSSGNNETHETSQIIRVEPRLILRVLQIA